MALARRLIEVSFIPTPARLLGLTVDELRLAPGMGKQRAEHIRDLVADAGFPLGCVARLAGMETLTAAPRGPRERAPPEPTPAYVRPPLGAPQQPHEPLSRWVARVEFEKRKGVRDALGNVLPEEIWSQDG